MAVCVVEVPLGASAKHGNDVSASTCAGAEPRAIFDENEPLDSWEWARSRVYERPHREDTFGLLCLCLAALLCEGWAALYILQTCQARR